VHNKEKTEKRRKSVKNERKGADKRNIRKWNPKMEDKIIKSKMKTEEEYWQKERKRAKGKGGGVGRGGSRSCYRILKFLGTYSNTEYIGICLFYHECG
jgi:hypothetical protein